VFIPPGGHIRSPGGHIRNSGGHIRSFGVHLLLVIGDFFRIWSAKRQSNTDFPKPE
jgi:hypothetical protein